MSLAVVVDALAEHLRAELGQGITVGDARPAGSGDLPAVTLSVEDATGALAGVGRVPRGTRQGALLVQAVVDLADPVLEIGTETVTLLSEDRRELTLPQGQLVRADGTDDPPFGPSDLTVTGPDGPLTVVAGDPAAGQVRPDPVAGILRFGEPLSASGDLVADYHVGRWDVRTVRFSGRLAVGVAAADADALAALARRVASALDASVTGFASIAPTSWGPAGSVSAPEDSVAQTLGFRFDFELEEPSLQSGGGLIRTIAVASHNDEVTEEFAVTREGSMP